MKTCTICKEQKTLDQFNKNRYRKDGLQNSCRSCDNEHSRKYYQENAVKQRKQIHIAKTARKQENVNRVHEYLEGHPCVDCGETDVVVLEFDHVRGSKIDSISRMLSDGSSWERIEEEIAKCEVRCANCHRRKTSFDYNWRKAIRDSTIGSAAPC